MPDNHARLDAMEARIAVIEEAVHRLEQALEVLRVHQLDAWQGLAVRKVPS